MISLNFQLRAKARQTLRDKWGPAVVITLVYMVISGPLSGFVNLVDMSLNIRGSLCLLSLFISIPLVYGLCIAFLNATRYSEEVKIKELFIGFKSYGKVFLTILLSNCYIMLWMLLFIIPGLIKSYSYAMTPYILADNPQMSSEHIIKQSMKMMRGKKMKLFLLDLSFVGWFLLAILTLGIGLLWCSPYMYCSRAHFYLELKEEYSTVEP